jgi:predicted nucleic acid-binding protein
MLSATRHRQGASASNDDISLIILDTNVVSEAMRPNCAPAVRSWLERQPVELLHLTVTSLAELLLGIELLPAGRRKESLRSDLERLLNLYFESRILAYDEGAAMLYARAIASARTQGLAISIADGQIAAIALVHGYAVATRDTGPFKAAGVQSINPWES